MAENFHAAIGAKTGAWRSVRFLDLLGFGWASKQNYISSTWNWLAQQVQKGPMDCGLCREIPQGEPGLEGLSNCFPMLVAKDLERFLGMKLWWLLNGKLEPESLFEKKFHEVPTIWAVSSECMHSQRVRKTYIRLHSYEIDFKKNTSYNPTWNGVSTGVCLCNCQWGPCRCWDCGRDSRACFEPDPVFELSRGRLGQGWVGDFPSIISGQGLKTCLLVVNGSISLFQQSTSIVRLIDLVNTFSTLTVHQKDNDTSDCSMYSAGNSVELRVA